MDADGLPILLQITRSQAHDQYAEGMFAGLGRVAAARIWMRFIRR